MAALCYVSIRHHSKRLLPVLSDCLQRRGHFFASHYGTVALPSRLPVNTRTNQWQSCRDGKGDVSKRLTSSHSSTNTKISSIKEARFDPTSRYVTVTCSDGHAHSYPLSWLRDNCQCERCFNPHTLSRSLLMADLNPELTIKSVKIDEQTNSVEIIWDDGHTSGFHVPWLLERSFGESAQKKRKSGSAIKAKYWDSKIQIPTDTFDRVMTDDRALLDWICHLEETGLFLLTRVPDENAMIRLGERVAFLRKTCYTNRDIFRVESREDVTKQAYSKAELELHTDMNFYKHKPGVQMLHCLEQPITGGGVNVFTDGFHVAEQLRAESPEHFQILTQTMVDYIDKGTDDFTFLYHTQVPVIRLDEHGNVENIAYNQQYRDSSVGIPLEKVEPLYKALKRFSSLLYSPQNAFHRKLKSGEMMCFNNMRVLHGRGSFSDTADCRRVLLGGFIDWDEMFSRMRVLRKQLGMEQYNF